MADNTTLPGTGEIIAADDVSGVKFQRIKLDVGADGASTPVTDAAPMKVKIMADDGDDGQLQIRTDANGMVMLGQANAGTKIGVVGIDQVTANANEVVLKASSANIGDVDVASVVPGVGATNLGKAEDAQHSSGDVGVLMLGVKKTNAASISEENDYSPLLTDGLGRLHVNALLASGSNVGLTGNVVVSVFGLTSESFHGVSAVVTNTTRTVVAHEDTYVNMWITHISVFNAHATVGTWVQIEQQDNTVIYQGYAAEKGGGFVVDFPMPLKAVGDNVQFECVTTGAAVVVNVVGYREGG